MGDVDPEDETPLGRVKIAIAHLEWLIEEIKDTPGGSRGRALATTKLQEALYWLDIGRQEEELQGSH